MREPVSQFQLYSTPDCSRNSNFNTCGLDCKGSIEGVEGFSAAQVHASLDNELGWMAMADVWHFRFNLSYYEQLISPFILNQEIPCKDWRVQRSIATTWFEDGLQIDPGGRASWFRWLRFAAGPLLPKGYILNTYLSTQTRCAIISRKDQYPPPFGVFGVLSMECIKE